MARRRIGILFVLALASCAGWRPPPVEPYFDGRLEEAERIFRARVDAADNDWILMANELATALDAQGRIDEAWRMFYDAGRAMAWYDTSFGESFRTIAGREDEREFKGDPYEQALNSIYTGLLAWRRGEPDNARASFKEAMLRDADSSDERFRSDMALSFLLAAWASRQMGFADDAAEFLAEARQARRSAVQHGARGIAEPSCLTTFADDNVLIVCSVGRGPEKGAGGRNGEVAVFLQPPQRVDGVEARIDGRSVGRGEILADVYFQAATRGGRWMDGVRQGKAVFKELSEVAGVVLTTQGLTSKKNSEGFLLAGIGLLLASALISAEADIRCWRTLPDTFQVVSARVPPGRHRLDVDFLGAGGASQPSFRQTLDLDVPERGSLVLHLRSIPLLPAVPEARRPAAETPEQRDPS